jgi:hypothetical protein
MLLKHMSVCCQLTGCRGTAGNSCVQTDDIGLQDISCGSFESW